MTARRLLLIAVAALALAPATASAATVSMTSHGLVVDSTGDGDAADDFEVFADLRTPSGEISRWEVFDHLCAIASAGRGCLHPSGFSCEFPDFGSPEADVTGSVVLCDRTATGVTIRAGGGDDNVRPVAEGDPVTVDLGAGDDTLQSFDEPSARLPLATGPWNVTAGPGNDVIQGSSGGNVVDAGPGNDIVETFPLELIRTSKTSINRDRPDLSAGDSVFGGTGNDDIDAGAGSDSVSGGDGEDTFHAGPDGDLLSSDAYDGGVGFDTIDYSLRTTPIFFDSGSTQSGANTTSPHELDRDSFIEHVILGSANDTALSLFDTATHRTFEGGAGDDILNGIGSNDTLIGGPGIDHLNGFGGNDTLDARDGTADAAVTCGDGTDVAKLDLHDPNPADASACETITREAVKEAPTVSIVAAHRTRTGVRVSLFCPRDDDRACRGRLDDGVAAVRYTIARGHGGAVALGRSRGAKLRVRSVEQGKLGLKTVIRTVRV